MNWITLLINFRKSQKRRRQLFQDVHYRMDLNRLSLHGKSLDSSYEQFAKQAREAEQKGDHTRALWLARQAQQLMQYRKASGQMQARLESAYAIRETNKTLSQIAETTANLVKTAQPLSALNPAELQTEMLLTQDSAQALIDANEQLFVNSLNDSPEEDLSAERFLKTLLAEKEHQQQKKEMNDTRKHLERLMSAHSDIMERR